MPAPNPISVMMLWAKVLTSMTRVRPEVQTGHRHRDAQHAHDQRQPGGHQRPEHQQQHQRW